MALYSDFLLTVDYDRTLTAPDSTIPQRNLDAIQYFMDNGGIFTVNTGRSIPMYQCIKTPVPTNAPLLLYNGGAQFDLSTRTLYNVSYIDLPMKKTLDEVIDLFPDLTVELQSAVAHYTFSDNPPWDAFYNRLGVPHCITSTDADLGPFMKFTLYSSFQKGSVSSLFESESLEVERMNYAEQLLRTRYGDAVEVFRSAPRIIDVHPKGVSKHLSARALQKSLQRKYLVCVGDAKNDINMLQGADYSFCPSDAIIADSFENVCSCADGAVADVIYQKIPGIIERSS